MWRWGSRLEARERWCRLGGVLAAAVVLLCARPAAAEEATITCAPTCVLGRNPPRGAAVKLSILVGGAPMSISIAISGKPALRCERGCELAWPGARNLAVVVDHLVLPVIVDPEHDPGPGEDEQGASDPDRRLARARPNKMAPRAVGPAVVEIPPAPPAQRSEDALDTYLEDVVMVGTECSGVVVAASAILTARHCAAAQQVRIERVGRRIESVRVTAADTPDDPEDDVALLWAERDLGVSIRGRTVRIDPAQAGLIRLAGYGTNVRSGRGGFGRKRHAIVPLSTWHCEPRLRARTGCRPGREVVVIAPAADSCNGDSGGPLLVRQGGRWKLAAITSRAVPGQGTACGRGGIYTPMDRIDPWLSRALQRGAR